jgi:hypothetical protein
MMEAPTSSWSTSEIIELKAMKVKAKPTWDQPRSATGWLGNGSMYVCLFGTIFYSFPLVGGLETRGREACIKEWKPRSAFLETFGLVDLVNNCRKSYARK